MSKKEKKIKGRFISLKEAAKISGYSPDYIGFLIREGKIAGRPMYTTISWETTAEEIISYKTKKRSKKNEHISAPKQISQKFSIFRERLTQEFKVVRLFLESFRFALPLIIVLILSFSILIGFILYFAFGNEYSDRFPQEKTEILIPAEKPLKY